MGEDIRGPFSTQPGDNLTQTQRENGWLPGPLTATTEQTGQGAFRIEKQTQESGSAGEELQDGENEW